MKVAVVMPAYNAEKTLEDTLRDIPEGSYDILLVVVDGRTGETVFSDQITDFKEKDERKLDDYEDMFDDLYTLENRLLGIFVPRTVMAKRYLYAG